MFSALFLLHLRNEKVDRTLTKADYSFNLIEMANYTGFRTYELFIDLLKSIHIIL